MPSTESHPELWATQALAAARPAVFWLGGPDRSEPAPPLAGRVEADLVVIGGGFSGLWTALLAVERQPGRRVIVLEAGRCGDQASGRNGGFAAASLTHGFPNGKSRWPEEIGLLDRLGEENLAAIAETVRRHAIDCDWRLTGEMTVATRPHEVDELSALAVELQGAGHRAELLDREAVRAELDSPTYLAGLYEPDGCALVEPGRLARGLRQACLGAGVEIREHSRVGHVGRQGERMVASTSGGQVHASQVALATNAFPPLLRRLRLMTVPVYDYVLMTEPLSAEQLASIGWKRRQGVGDASNCFHYYRLTRDNRILWGGYDAVYHYGSRIEARLEQRGRTHELLARQFFETFPQLEGLRFTHRWAGVIDTCTRFAAFYGTAYGGDVAYALGYTGLGVAATRFGAEVMLDLLTGEETERTSLRMVREQPIPFPPEPARALGINLTRRALMRADARGGRRSVWLRALDRAGLGFDS